MGNVWNTNYIECESIGNRNKTLSIKEYLDVIKAYLKYIINDLQQSDTWEIQLIMEINFIYFKELDKECFIHLKSENIEILNHNKADNLK